MKNDKIPEAITQGIVAMASISGNPEIAIATAMLSPMIKDVSIEMYGRVLSDLQVHRVKDVICQIIDKITLKLSNGKQFRADSFVTKENGIMLKQTLEGLLLNAMEEFENKKVDSYSDLFANLCFDERVTFEQAIAIIRIVKQLSYRQLCIIALAQQNNLQTVSWDVKFKQSSSLNQYADFFSEVLSLYNLRILQQTGFGISLSMTNLSLSQFGILIAKQLGLNTVPASDIEQVREYIVRINSL